MSRWLRLGCTCGSKSIARNDQRSRSFVLDSQLKIFGESFVDQKRWSWKVQSGKCHPERPTREASRDADVNLEEQDESEGTQPRRAKDGGEGVLRGSTRCRTSRDQSEDSRAKETTDESTYSGKHACQMSFGTGERLLPENLVVGSQRQISNVVGCWDQKRIDSWLCRYSTWQEKPNARQKKSIPNDFWSGTEKEPRHWEMSFGRRAGPQFGTLARDEVGLRQGAASLLQSVRPVRAVRADR